eukprot:TRINITY_DN4387_c0_g1_i5.p1 TRINITY_DN4387_c0_g1~~TRINITY_DN4387_c0_g1_i5.p1  ORF type:complete len:119 (-),score=13.26 TRINITY_DN4387_c0_g1_i5:153-509(-)
MKLQCTKTRCVEQLSTYQQPTVNCWLCGKHKFGKIKHWRAPENQRRSNRMYFFREEVSVVNAAPDLVRRIWSVLVSFSRGKVSLEIRSLDEGSLPIASNNKNHKPTHLLNLHSRNAFL